MKLSTWKPSLRLWLSQYVTIDSFALAVPDLGQTLAFLPPVRDINYGDNGDDVYGTFIQDVFLRQRYADLAYADLPMAAIEGFYQTLAVRLQTQWKAIAALTDLEVLRVDSPMVFSETGNGQWLLEVCWSVRVRYLAEPEADFDRLFDLKAIALGVYRERLNGQGSSLDLTLRLPT